MTGAKKSPGGDLQAVQPSGPASNPAGSTTAQPPSTAEMQARHGNGAFAQAALAGSNAPPAAGPNPYGGLPSGVRNSMEAAFGRSFSGVRVSEGERVRSGQLALTEGLNIDFAPGHFKPETPAGRFLLAHELTHVVQQQNGGGAAALAKSDGSRAPARPDLESEANSVASQIAAGGGGPVQVMGSVAPGEPVTLAFEAREHVLAAWKANQGWVQFGKFYIPWAFTAAMADLFDDIDQARNIAENDPKQFEAVLALQVAEPVPGRRKPGDESGEPDSITSEEPIETSAINQRIGQDKKVYHPKLREALGEIDELLKIAAVDPGQFRGMSPKPGKRKTEKDFKNEAPIIKRRYYKLASDNIGHFLNPDRGDIDRSVLEKIQRRPNASKSYYLHHERAIWEAVKLGTAHKSINDALISEGWAAHFLTDSFSGGHIRSVRRDSEIYWNERAPLFYDNMVGYLAERLAKELNNRHKHSFTSIFSEGTLRDIARSELKKKLKDFPRIGGGLAMGALPQHDLDNQRGVWVVVNGKTMLLKGDTRVDQAVMTQAQEAIQLSLGEVEQAYKMGSQGKAFDDVAGALKKNGLYAAQHLIPRVVADEHLASGDKSVPWENMSAEALFKDENFKRGIKRFLELKADDFTSILAGLPGYARDAMKETVLKEMTEDPVGLVKNILNWTPAIGGRAKSVEYLAQVERNDNLQGLTYAQRKQLAGNLLRERMNKKEAHLLRTLLLTAPPDQVRLIIKELKMDRLAAALGPKFTELVSELPGP